MGKKRIDLCGQKFGRLAVIEYTGGRWVPYRCQCDCGNETVVLGGHLRSGRTRSCGCITGRPLERHGKTKSQVYHAWAHMKSRCFKPQTVYYHRYGGRGITVCARWRDSFVNFYEDMGDPPTLSHSLDRINNDGDYTPENCRWATRAEQQRNKSSNRMLTFSGKTMTLTEWSGYTGIGISALNGRLNKLGWTTERALTEPVHKRICTK